MQRTRPLRLTVRTPGFHPGNTGSIPVGVTIRRGDGDWHEALQLVGARPPAGPDEAAWRGLAVGLGASVTRVPLGRGVVLFDVVAGTGHGRALFPGGDWSQR